MSKVKIFAAIPKKQGISLQEFHDHWRHPHGTLGRRISTMRKYVQSHRVETDMLPGPFPYEEIAEVWMDSADDAFALGSEPKYVRDAVPDEPLFIELTELRFLVTVEDVVSSGPDHHAHLSPGDAAWFDDGRAVDIKLIQLILDEDEWASNSDAQLGLEIGAFRHVRCNPVETPDGSVPYFRGVRELWWPTLWAFQEGTRRSPEAFATLISRPQKAITLLAQAERFK
ncbi:EthD domain-containing protein [Sphingobium faniae]|nr:EthD domain-containing protein [Sphingobium faniae]